MQPPWLGPGVRAERAGSIGWVPLGHENPKVLPPVEAGRLVPARPPDKPAHYYSKRADLTPGPWDPLAPTS
ncbi:MAG: hypothetical protein NTV04_07740, partial [Deltaproteobacteria bacterium]|nr:hypothetical protein [Deltaproteobacteria bacterium]